VLDILEIVDNQGIQFEKTPVSYKPLGENALRDIILTTLNSIFAGSATGETFSYRGKTDIYLRIDKGNILIFECKFWGGQKLYQETIDQLLRYLTWRQNFGVIISFVRQKDFSKILSSTPTVVQSHPSYRNNIEQLENHHSYSVHALPNDTEKTVEIHHLFYNLYSD
jgi:hypothetical protein